MWEHYSAPTRPFRTFQNKAVVSSNCAQRPAPPSCCLHLCQPPTSLTASSKVQLDLWPRLKELFRLLLFCPHPVSTLGRLDHMWVKVVWWDWRCLWSGGCCPCCCAVFTAWPHSFASTPTATTVSLAELGESVWYLKILYCSNTNPGPVSPEPKWYQLFLNAWNACDCAPPSLCHQCQLNIYPTDCCSRHCSVMWHLDSRAQERWRRSQVCSEHNNMSCWSFRVSCVNPIPELLLPLIHIKTNETFGWKRK